EKSTLLIHKTKTPKITPSPENKIPNLHYFQLFHILQFKNPQPLKHSPHLLQYKLTYQTPQKTLYPLSFSKSPLSPISNSTTPINHAIHSQNLLPQLIKQKPTVPSLFLT
ncbi:hypothetical protein, partial [Staphylococcus epidermidis]|uniref:hypothetical protein n=1 Tax=Staphylococcus epidermidis TaxID=1282 RepID=UPI001C936D57